ncbi:MAG: FAD-dependent oxidoreductase, partial [Candidatus Rokuibacteriota bacterium]
MVRKHKHLILGAGLTGLSCAYHLEDDSTVYERLPEIGGLARSEETAGFIFDYAPHILYTIDPYASKLIHELLKGNIHVKQRRAFIYHGKYNLYTQFPFQAHLYGLPGHIVSDCLKGVVKAVREADTYQPTNYKE